MNGLALGLGLTPPSRGAAIGSYTAEAEALFARMDVQPGIARRRAIDTLMTALVTIGLAKFDALYVMAAHDAQAARLNWKADAFNLALVNAPSFLMDRGYAGNAIDAWLTTGFNPATAGGVYTQNSCHAGLWSLTDTHVPVSNDSAEFGNVSAQIRKTQSVAGGGTVLAQGTATTVASIPSAFPGHIVWSRSGASAWDYYVDGALVASPTTASSALTSANFLVCARDPASAINQRGINRIAVVHWGADLSDGEVAALHAGIAAYLAAVAAI